MEKRLCPECGKPLRCSGSNKRWHCDNPACTVQFITYIQGKRPPQINRIVEATIL